MGKKEVEKVRGRGRGGRRIRIYEGNNKEKGKKSKNYADEKKGRTVTRRRHDNGIQVIVQVTVGVGSGWEGRVCGTEVILVVPLAVWQTGRKYRVSDHPAEWNTL